MAVGAQPLDQSGGIDPLDRRLAGRIDRGDEDHVGIVEGIFEIGPQVTKAGETMRLHDRDHP